MFDQKFEDRMSAWRDFRQSLSTSTDPIQDVIDFYNQAPTVSINADPYTADTWPGPWELLEENIYCEYCKLLGICYTLQLTEHFNQNPFEIHIGIDRDCSMTYYLLYVGNRVIGYEADTHVHKDTIPESIQIQKIHAMPELH